MDIAVIDIPPPLDLPEACAPKCYEGVRPRESHLAQACLCSRQPCLNKHNVQVFSEVKATGHLHFEIPFRLTQTYFIPIFN